MATFSCISFNLFVGRSSVGGFPCRSVALTIVDHRRATDPPPVLLPCPGNYLSPHLYHAAMEDIAAEIFCRRLHLRACCISRLLPQLLAKIDFVNAFHSGYGIHNIQLHVFPELTPTAHISVDATLRESFEAAQPKPTPASSAWIEKLVADKEGDDSSCSNNDEDGDSSNCMICLDEIIARRSSLKMPCSRVFHESCIVEWLKVSHVCPLCRYQMPVDDDEDFTADSDH